MNNKKFIFLSIIIIGLSLASCTFMPSSSVTSKTTSSKDVSLSTTSSHSSYKTNYKQEIMKETYKDLTENNLYQISSIPNIGNANFLVIPVWFTDSNSVIPTYEKDNVLNRIDKAFFGKAEDVGWESVKTYYEKESRNKVNIFGEVAPWYECGYSSKEVDDVNVLTDTVVESAVKNWKKKKTYKEIIDFDQDEDGYLDAVILIYAAHNFSHPKAIGNENLWAYCYWLQQPGNIMDPRPNHYMWASYDFMDRDTRYVNIDTHTYIHEVGHLFGLQDYYDYNEDRTERAGAFSMQDYNVGGHDPFSIMALGWVNPYVIYGDSNIEIKPFQESGDLILLTNSFNNTPFDEYILIEYYSNSGLNKFDSDYAYLAQYPKGPNADGLRIWHVDARLISYDPIDGFTPNLISTGINSRSLYGFTELNSNTTYSKDTKERAGVLCEDYPEYRNYHLLELIRNGDVSGVRKNELLSTASLFCSGTFSLEKYNGYFANNNKLNNGKSLTWNVKIDTIDSKKALLTITL